MKNVLQLIGSFHQGGSERQAVQLARLLHEDKTFNVFVATLNKEGTLLKEMEQMNLPQIPEFKLTSFYSVNFLQQVQKCAKFIRNSRIEIVHTHDFYTNLFGMCAAALARVPLKIASKRETGGMRSRSQRIIEKFAFRQANAIVANSEAVKNYLVSDGISAEKIDIIYNGLDLRRFTPRMSDRNWICAELGLPGEENIKFITLVANLRHTVKNQPMFLRVAEKVLQKFPDAHFVLAGEGELLESLKNLTQELKIAENTHLIGRCTRVPELLSISSVGVLTSFNEGFSNSILEYMAAGLPVVATNVGGASEAIIENETGFLVESDDTEAMANRLNELLQTEEKARKFGAKGRKRAEEKFSCNSQLARTIELYRKSSE